MFHVQRETHTELPPNYAKTGTLTHIALAQPSVKHIDIATHAWQAISPRHHYIDPEFRRNRYASQCCGRKGPEVRMIPQNHNKLSQPTQHNPYC